MVYWFVGFAQPVSKQLMQAVQRFEKDSQMKHAILGFSVADAKTGKVLYEHNSQVGLAPASTQKIITSGAAFELLGHDYRYKTQLAYEGNIEKGNLRGNILVIGSGDPTLGSWRYTSTRDTVVMKDLVNAVRKKGITRIEGGIVIRQPMFSGKIIPDGWIWQDIGNYYGAGAHALNWKENQYDVVLRSGDKIGANVEVLEADNELSRSAYRNELASAAKGTGDNAYIYLSTHKYGHMLLEGTIPVDEKTFTISGATQDPGGEFEMTFRGELQRWITFSDMNEIKSLSRTWVIGEPVYFHTYYSPPLDSINNWFMRRSINLYGEALVKTIAFEKKKHGDTDEGITLVKEFWSQQGIDKAAINIIDGSGLSPQNRVTADALVKALVYARSRPWFRSFYESVPTYNGMKLKSGSIGGARAFAGYHTSAGGKEYAVAIIANNYSGSSADMVKKMYKVLDVLK